MSSDNNLPKAFQQFELLYRELDAAAVMAMPTIYADNVVFIDPVHRMEGLDALQAYTRKLMGNVQECRFECEHWLCQGQEAVVQWTMHMRHASLRRGEPIALKGVSLLKLDAQGRICWHEDFYDLGAMVYEHVPLLGAAVRSVKHRLAGAA